MWVDLLLLLLLCIVALQVDLLFLLLFLLLLLLLSCVLLWCYHCYCFCCYCMSWFNSLIPSIGTIWNWWLYKQNKKQRKRRKQSITKRRWRVRLMLYFQIIVAIVAAAVVLPLSFLRVCGYTIFHTIILSYYHYRVKIKREWRIQDMAKTLHTII